MIQIEQLLSKRKFNIPDVSRFNEYLKILRDTNSDSRMESLAHSEISKLILILHHIKDLQQWSDTLEIALKKDSLKPLNNEKTTLGRNLFFEVYVAARLEAAGIQVNKGEPDLICNKNGFNFTVAAKRIRSFSKIETRFREARNQIIKTNLPGIIVLDISALHKNFYSGLPVMTNEGIRINAKKYIDETNENILPKLSEICKSEQVLGVISFASLNTLTPDNNQSSILAEIHNCHSFHSDETDNFKHFKEIGDGIIKTRLGPVAQK